MDSMAVANETQGHYQSFGVGGPLTRSLALGILLNDVDFAGPFTLVEERDVYIPGENSEGRALYPDREVLVYDSYGGRMERPGDGFTDTAGVYGWIDEHLEAEAAGEYAIGQVLDVDDLDVEGRE
jgi:hypothetical protein